MFNDLGWDTLEMRRRQFRLTLMYKLQCDVPYLGHLTKFFLRIVHQSRCVNLIDSHVSLQSSHSCKLNTIARVVELTCLHVIVKCESLLGGHGKARCTVTQVSWSNNYY